MASSAPEQKPTSSASQQAQWSLQPLAASQVEEAHSLEAAGYPADEGASVEKLKWRQEHAGDFFFSCIGREERNEGAVLGFICSTVVTGPLTEEGRRYFSPKSMSPFAHLHCSYVCLDVEDDLTSPHLILHTS